MIQINLFAKQKQTYNILTKRLSILKTNYGYQRETWGCRTNQEIGMNIHTLLLYIRQTTINDLLYSTGMSTQHSVAI